MTTEERLEIVERELARAKSRNYWLAAGLGLALCLFALSCYGYFINLRGEVRDLGDKVLKLSMNSSSSDYLQTSVNLLFEQVEQDKRAIFDPTASEGYQRLNTSVGSLVVSIQDVKPYGDGVKVRVEIGNPTTAQVTRGTFKVKWGSRGPILPEWSASDSEGSSRRYGEWKKASTEWKKTLKEREVEFTEKLLPGTWSNVDLKLPGTPPDQFGYLELQLLTQQIGLRIAR